MWFRMYIYINNIWKLHRHHHGSNHRQNMKQSSVHVADSCQPKIGFKRNILTGIRFDNNDDEDEEHNEDEEEEEEKEEEKYEEHNEHDDDDDDDDDDDGQP